MISRFRIKKKVKAETSAGTVKEDMQNNKETRRQKYGFGIRIAYFFVRPSGGYRKLNFFTTTKCHL